MNTFGPEENDILEVLSLFEQELEEKLQDTDKSIEKVKYYQEFNMNGIDFRNIFITTEKDEKGNISYHIYCKDYSNEILSLDAEGNIKVKNPDLERFLGEVDLNKIIEENENVPGKLKGISEKATPEEMKKALKGEDKATDKKERDEEQDEETQEVEEELEEQGEDLRISKYRKIKDTNVAERMPDVFGNGKENGLAYSNKLHRFVMISKENGQYQINENAEPARMTWKSVISIDPNGESVERKVPHALMDTNRDDKKIAVTIGQYGEIDIETVEVRTCKEKVEYISRGVRSEGEGLDKQQSYKLSQNSKESGKNGETDIANGQEEIEQAQRDANKTVDYSITEDDYIPNTEMTWGELMEETGESLPKLIERYNRDMEKNTDSKKVVEAIEADYGKVNRQQEHRPN